MDFSDEQKKIINAKINNNLVSASAGSGKTTVLTERIAEEVKNDLLKVDEMLVVTFTEDAASHMANKIEEALRKKRKEVTDSKVKEKISDQIDLLPNAYIQTMHGFCSRVIKEKGYLIENSSMAEFTDPNCRIISEGEQKILLQSAVEMAIKELYSKCESQDDPFIRFTRRFGDGRSDFSLIPIVERIYLSLRSLPDYLERCNELLNERIKRNEEQQIMSDKDFEDFKEVVVSYFSKVKELFEGNELELVLADHPKYQIVKEMPNEEFIGELTTKIGRVIEESDSLNSFEFIKCVQSLREFDNYKYSNFFTNADINGDDKPLLAIATFRHFIKPGCLTKYKNGYDLPKEYIEILSFDPDEILDNQKAGTEAVEQFVKILVATDDKYMKLKNQMHGMDYSDLEHTAYEILKPKGENKVISEAAAFYKEKFTEIFVDEYQDNTRLQDAIIDCFCRETGNVFRVGDIKQSIYKFRYADPTIFKERMNNYLSPNVPGEVHYLSENHRSTCEILAFANYVFEQIMTENASEIEYDEDQHLHQPANPKHGEVPRIIIADKGEYSDETINEEDADDGVEGPADSDSIVDTTNSENRAILAAVEREVKRYLEDCTRIDKTKTDFKDICILTSSNGQAERIARYLNKCTLSDGRKIEASGRFTTDVFEDMDIHRLINLLICLGNEYRDEYVASVLLSNYRFSNFTVEELARIQMFIHEMDMEKALDKEPLMLRLRIFAQKSNGELAQRVKAFIDVFDDLRMNSMVTDIDEIIELIYRETGIKATLEARTGDSNKFDIFKDWLSDNFKKRGSDISGIADELEKMKIQIKEANIEVTDASKNKITTMTLHKSKGLEFPFVILIANGGSDEKKDNLSSMMFDTKDGFITEDYDTDNLIRRHSFEQYVYQLKMNLAINAETCRLLYVALTRAEEQLSIITVTDVSKPDNANPVKSAFIQAYNCEEKQFSKRHWLAGNMKLPYCLFSALARSADGELLRDASNAGELGRSTIPFRDLDNNVATGFHVEYMSPEEVARLYNSHMPHEVEESKPEKEKAEFDAEGKLVFPEYKFQDSVEIPFKLSVTGIADVKKPADSTHVDLQVRSIDDFESPNVSMLTAAAKGTILHRIMRFIDLEGIRNGSTMFELEIESLINEGYLNICSPDNARDVAFEFREGIEAFCKAPQCEDVIKSFADGSARSEKPIVFSVFVDGSEGDSVLVQGIIDLLYKTAEGYTILDYKTDRLGGVTQDDRAKEALERHAFQLNSYAAACEEEGLTVVHKLLYLVRYGEFVEV